MSALGRNVDHSVIRLDRRRACRLQDEKSVARGNLVRLVIDRDERETAVGLDGEQTYVVRPIDGIGGCYPEPPSGLMPPSQRIEVGVSVAEHLSAGIPADTCILVQQVVLGRSELIDAFATDLRGQSRTDERVVEIVPGRGE